MTSGLKKNKAKTVNFVTKSLSKRLQICSCWMDKTNNNMSLDKGHEIVGMEKAIKRA